MRVEFEVKGLKNYHQTAHNNWDNRNESKKLLMGGMEITDVVGLGGAADSAIVNR